MTNKSLIALAVFNARTAWRLYLRYQREGLPFTATRWRADARLHMRAARQLKQDARS